MKREIIDDILDPDYHFEFEDDNYDYSSDYVDSICLNCGKTDSVPDFIYNECSRKKYHLKLNKNVSTLECGYCEKETLVPSPSLKNEPN